MHLNVIKSQEQLPEAQSVIFNFSKEKERRADQKRTICPRCKAKSTKCPEWISGIWPTDEAFADLSADEMLEWLDHTTHLTG